MRLRSFLRQWDLQIGLLKSSILWHEAMISHFYEHRPENYERCIRFHTQEAVRETEKLKEYL
jgi:hypothetical protein